MSGSERYNVNIVFRGLILAQPVNNRLAILLPDARTPQQLIPDDRERRALAVNPNLTIEQQRRQRHGALDRNGTLGRYREHHGMIEFQVDHWQNPKVDPPQAVRLTRQGEPEVLVYLIGGDRPGSKSHNRLRFVSARGDAPSVPAVLRGDRQDYNHTLSSSDHLKVLEGDGIHSYHHLPPFRSDIDTLAWRQCLAFASFEIGEAYSDRQCLGAEGPLRWTLRSVDEIAFGPVSRTPPATRPLNLDLHLRFSLHRADSLLIRVEPESPTTPGQEEGVAFFPPLHGSAGREEFILRPRDSESELQVLIKNRELSQALLELPTGESTIGRAGQPVSDDIDHGLYMELAATPGTVAIPQIVSGGPIANTGCACGVCGGGGGI